jgi:glycosyltransferase involved in cell wall biosynthesis
LTVRLCVVEPDGKGGLAQFAHQLCAAIAAPGTQVTLITSTDYELAHLANSVAVDRRLKLWSRVDPDRGRAGSPWSGTLLRAGRKVRRAWRGAVLLLEWSKLVVHLRALRPDVVQFGSMPFPFFVLFLAALRRSGLTLTQVCHEFERRDIGSWWYRRLHAALTRRLYAQFSVIAFLSDATRRAFIERFGIQPGRLVVIPHGNQDIFKALRSDFDPAERYGLAAGTRILLFFGFIRPSKGLEDLLEALAMMSSDPTIRLVVAGYPSQHLDVAALHARAAALGITDRTIFDLRYIAPGEVAGLIELATIVVLPYRSATQSGVVQLAYSFARPVVAAAVGDLVEAVEHGGSGLLVPPRDPPALADALQRLLDDPDARRRMGSRAAELSSTRYSWSEPAGTLLAAYHEAVRQGEGHA